MKSTIPFFIGLSAALLSLGCTQDEDLLAMYSAGLRDTETGSVPPSLQVKVTSINSTGATVEGYIDNPSGFSVSRRGFVYSAVNDMPLLKQDGTESKVSSVRKDTFSTNLSGLTAGRTVYIRSYIIYNGTEDKDTVYSDPTSFIPRISVPEVTTLSVFNRVKKAAIVCGRFTKPGDDLRSYGVCLSRNPLPDVKNDTYVAAADTATDATYHGIFGVFFDELEENTMYHVRSYAITATDTVYGNDRVFKTTHGGTFNWQFNNREGAAADGAEKRIEEAVDSAMHYYRNYTNLNKYLWVNYSPGTPTADCNIEGWMRVGSVARYQWVGTIQHEMCHALGVGTASNWRSFASQWDQPGAVLTLRVMMKDMSVWLTHDTQHFWPGGINQQEEVTNGTANNKKTYTLRGALMLKANALIINAMREDGLTSY